MAGPSQKERLDKVEAGLGKIGEQLTELLSRKSPSPDEAITELQGALRKLGVEVQKLAGADPGTATEDGEALPVIQRMPVPAELQDKAMQALLWEQMQDQREQAAYQRERAEKYMLLAMSNQHHEKMSDIISACLPMVQMLASKS